MKHGIIAFLLCVGSVIQAQVKAPRTPLKARVNTVITAAGTVHSVTLSGCVDTLPGVMFDFFRGSIAGGESLTPLNASPLATCNFVDNTVLALGSYFYSVRAYCATCNPSLSGPDEIGPELIPPDGQPPTPTGLTAGPIANNQVPLFWNAPLVEAGVTVKSYSLWRGSKPTLPAPGRIATILAPTQTYIDKGCVPVPPATTRKCYYEARANDVIAGLNVLSGPSNIAQAITGQ